jgi:hypothetical protein
MTTLTPGRRRLYEQIATLLAGNRSGDAFAAVGVILRFPGQ